MISMLHPGLRPDNFVTVSDSVDPWGAAPRNEAVAVSGSNPTPQHLQLVNRTALEADLAQVNRVSIMGELADRIREHIEKAPPRKERFDLNAAISEVIALARGVIIRSGVSVQIRLADGLFLVQGDRVQLQQVVLNLILNAVDAMGSVEAGARELSISTEQDHTPFLTRVLVAVRDSGPGIDPEHLELIFKSFYTAKPGGTGLGLSICRSIIDAHGGRLWAEANEPRGAVFQFTLPGS